jgi:hypothetical protein
MLATQTGILRGNTSTIGAVATGAGRDLTLRNTATVNTLTQHDQLLVGCRTGLGLFGRYPIRDIFHVFIGQRGCESLHDGIGPLVGLEFLQLFDHDTRDAAGPAWGMPVYRNFHPLRGRRRIPLHRLPPLLPNRAWPPWQPLRPVPARRRLRLQGRVWWPRWRRGAIGQSTSWCGGVCLVGKTAPFYNGASGLFPFSMTTNTTPPTKTQPLPCPALVKKARPPSPWDGCTLPSF